MDGAKMPTVFEAVMDRIKAATGLRTQVELAAAFDIRQSSVSDAKRRDTIPDSWLVKLLLVYGLSPDWILRGEGPAYLKGDPDREGPAILRPTAPAPEPEPELTIAELKGILEARLGSGLEVVIVASGRRVIVEADAFAGTASGLAMLMNAASPVGGDGQGAMS